MGETVIKCDHISKKFESLKAKNNFIEVLNDVSFDVRAGEFTVLLGPGQCGKTTLLNIIAGHELPSGGRVLERDNEIKDPAPSRGMVYQDIRLFPWLTVMGNVSYGPKVQGIDKKDYLPRAQKFIDLVGLTGFEDTYPIKLSGGMKQRVGIARAYCNQPDIILMDEPFGALDAQTRYMMQEELSKIWQKEKNTVLFVTNNIEEAVYLADRIIVFSRCPAKIKKEYQINIPRPRKLTSVEFLELRKEITAQIEDDM
ncbi:ABC transporter ATP-binding protein [Mediterraneibacter sp. NSJ-55]|uniref:ABC transporter ATP-binding protein n=1 Tax=Mediterraneibacter hominis TaxID=2763054 RepID=A0A923LLJ4_9FIRM|nr:ABC transporter ATP-binding protein [Mediterraneibacter hominis]MBC5690454.1 ABC transporter ATP-binding protein [Mediterraneibacter hominis]